KNETAQMKKSEKFIPKSFLFKHTSVACEAQSLFVKYGYNVFLSNPLPLDRPLPDTRDPLVRHSEQRGLAYARASGCRAATADVVAILDAHIEVHEMWAEPLLTQIKADRTVVVSPVFDKVSFDDLKVTTYHPSAHAFDWALWCMYESFTPEYYKLNDGSLPGKSPSVMGILVADRKFLGEIGVLDEGMKVYGGENVELGIRVWTCGGSVEVVPCSKIAHIERAHKPYMPDLGPAMKRNALRVAEIWMDEYKHNVNLAWNIPFENHGIDIGDISERKKLRFTLDPWDDLLAYGGMKNLDADMCLDQGPVPGHTPIAYNCHYYVSQLAYYRGTGELYIGGIKAHKYNDNRCLADIGTEETEPGLYNCKEAVQKGMGIYWDFTQGKELKNRKTKRCLEVTNQKLLMRECTGQRWQSQHIAKPF
uniref:Polypeptide N-acetylgalactosaminyltransferase n=1 Tax=Maylandia zebra TaxID=106582 RepID=A0A3P9CJG7_9CICH